MRACFVCVCVCVSVPVDTSQEKGEKRPLSAYMLFAKDKRPEVIKKNPGLSFGEVRLAVSRALCSLKGDGVWRAPAPSRLFLRSGDIRSLSLTAIATSGVCVC